MSQYHKVVGIIKNLLDEHGCDYDFFEHDPVRTSEEAAQVRPGYTLKQGAKAILTRVRIPNEGKRFVMFVLPADQRLSKEKLKQNLSIKEFRFVTEDEVDQLTDGVLPGGVPPFGNLFNLDVYVDPTLFDNERIVFNCGDRRASIGMLSIDYRNLVDPIIVEIT